LITIAGFNTSLDRTATTDALRPGGVNRVRDVRTYPGGKGLHVALTVAALGEPVRLVGLIDEPNRSLFEEGLRTSGVEFHGVPTSGRLRTCLAIRERGTGRITEILEPGPEADPDTRNRLCALFLDLAADSDLAVLSGSVPPGFAEDVYGELVSSLRKGGVRCLVDASGGLLRGAVDAQPLLIKPNREELAELVGEPIDGATAAVKAARGLTSKGPEMVVVSLGAEGALAVQGDRAWRAEAPRVDVANAVGSGDCLLGGLAVGLRRGLELEEVLRLGVACGTANATSPETGWVMRADIDPLLPRVQVTGMD
jgi:1-phosphofructokinase family hexose kinase